MSPRNSPLISIVALLYIAHALPLYFFNVAIPAILRQQGVDVRWIGMLSLLYLPWAFKFFWATAVDNHYSERIGKRKTWLLSTQIVVVMGLAILANLDWTQISLLILVSFCISTASATQDIAIDGYTIERFDESQFGLVSATQSVGVAMGSMLGGAGVLWLYEMYNWQVAIFSLATLIVAISVTLIFLPEPRLIKSSSTAPTSSNQYASSIASTSSIVSSTKPLNKKQLNKKSLNKASLKTFFKRKEVKWLLILIVVFRFVEAPAMAMLNPMLIDFGWGLSQIGFLFSVLGAGVGILSAITAGILVKKQGAVRWLLVSGWLRTAIYFGLFVVLTQQAWVSQVSQFGLFGQDSFDTVLGATILALLAIRYMTMTALYAVFMTHSSKDQAGTDFTVFVCIELLVFFIGGALSGFLVYQFGYSHLFLLLAVFSVLSMLATPILFKKLKSIQES